MEEIWKIDEINTGPIVIYDGECSLCRSAVKFMKSENSPSGIRFVPSSDSSVIPLLDVYKIPKETTGKTVILLEGNKSYTKSTAILKTLIKKGSIWRVARVLFLVPPFIRDAVYDWLARIRK